MNKKGLKQKYQQMADWNLYRLEQNKSSLEKLMKLLPELDNAEGAAEVYEADLDDLQSLRLIYETSIRNFESKVDIYRNLISELE